MNSDLPTGECGNIFDALARSKFRSRFRLQAKERSYLEEKGLEEVMRHAREFLKARLFPADPENDGKQTPMRGHPVFVAQHATAVCCRGCVAKWHRIPPGRPLAAAEQDQVLTVIRLWLERQLETAAISLPPRPPARQQELHLE